MDAAGSIESGKEVSAPTGRFGHKLDVFKLERSPPEAPAFWAEQDLRPGRAGVFLKFEVFSTKNHNLGEP